METVSTIKLTELHDMRTLYLYFHLLTTIDEALCIDRKF
jgi:hypothetical protein